MSEWISFELGRLGQFSTSSVDKKLLPNQKLVNLINYMDVYRSNTINSKIEFMKVSASDAERVRSQVKKGDILFTPSSETPDDIGHSAVVSEELANTLNSYHTVRFRPYDEQSLDIRFSAWFCNSTKVRKQFERKCAGSTRYTLSIPSFNATSVTFPESTIEQRKIANILDSIQLVIEKTDSLINKFQQIKIGLMQDLFNRGIGADGKLRPTRETAPELYCKTDIGWIPNDWSAVTLLKIVHFQRGHDIVTSEFIEGKYPVVSSGGIIGYHNKFTTTGPSVVVGRKGTIGKVHFLEKSFWAHDTSLFSTTLNDNDPLFVFYLCNWLDLGKYGTKSGSPSLNRNDIHPLGVARPNPDEQVKIRTRLASCDSKIDSLKQDLKKYNALKNGLMSDLLEGKKQVSVNAAEAACV